jgi:hypothetical protein
MNTDRPAGAGDYRDQMAADPKKEIVMSTVAITGNTYPVKDQIKALGGRWNADQKCWMVSAEKADAAKALVAGAPKSSFQKSTFSSYSPKKCCVCGLVEHRNSRGYVDGDRILRSGECQSCYEERKMGY